MLWGGFAALVILAVAGCSGVGSTLRSPVTIDVSDATGQTFASTTPAGDFPIPAGDQAVDALGIEIFVPERLALDPPCPGDSVSRPAYGLTYALGCRPFVAPEVWIGTAQGVITGAVPPRSTSHCLRKPVLDGETGCVVKDKLSDATTTTVSAIWPKHDVAIEIQTLRSQTAWAMGIFASAHWVPVDRNGCAATRTPVGLADQADTPGASILPSGTASLSVCWYSGNRLVASASVDASPAIKSLAHPAGISNGPGIGAPPTYTPQPAAPSCTDLDKTDGVLFIAHRRGQPDADSTAQLADCRGEQQWTTGTISVAAGEPLASALREQAGFLIAFGYQARR